VACSGLTQCQACTQQNAQPSSARCLWRTDLVPSRPHTQLIKLLLTLAATLFSQGKCFDSDDQLCKNLLNTKCMPLQSDCQGK
jgi:hypothetical protein